MKTIYKHMALAALTISLAACSQEEEFAQGNSDIVQIASAHIATEVQTRVNTDGNGDIFENEDEILLVNNSRDNKNEGTYVYDGTSWSRGTTGMVLWATNTTEANNFTAYYPPVKEFTLPANQKDLAGLKSADRMIATASAVKGNDVVLSFAHQNAKVTVNVTLESSFTGTEITDFKIGDIEPYGGGSSYTAILQPGTGFTVAFAVSNESITATTEKVLEAGKHYTFNLTITRAEATLTVSGVEDWKVTPLTDYSESNSEFNGNIDATNMPVEKLKSRVAWVAANGVTDITITLPADASTEEFSALFDAFKDASPKIASINLTLNGVTHVPENAFYNPEAGRTPVYLKTLTLTDVEIIGDNAFNGIGNMTNISIPKVKKIGQMAFASCKRITEVNAPELTELGESAFTSCYSIQTANLPKVTTIGCGALAYCNGLTSITFGNLTSVDTRLFEQGATYTGNITLHLSSDQKTMEKDTDNIWRPTETAYKDSEDYTNKSFIGYTFKEVIVGEE